ncbi:hypothetical protein [Brevibacterium album]|uniref:hypothetical protein n=1 Tax=Brevibacterium album TaxID=417948 RepID=UPI0004001815|nr:hypothetical protein [Brevibacterium album]
MSDELTTTGLSRRSVAKGAAWSVPVLAAAVSVPMASASVDPGDAFDVAVSADCAGNYDLAQLRQGLSDIVGSLPGGALLQPLLTPITNTLVDTTTTLLSGLGFDEFESRGFTILAAEGTVPAGTQFTLTGGGLINITLLEDALGGAGADALGLVSINGDDAIIELNRDLAQGEQQHITLRGDAVDVSVGGTVTFGLVGTDNPSTEPGQPNSVSQNFVVVETSLGELGLVNQLLDAVEGIPGIGAVLSIITGPLRTALEALTVTLQLCPGQDAPAGA